MITRTDPMINSSKISEYSNLRVRDWLNSQSFEEQYKYGLDVLKKYGY